MKFGIQLSGLGARHYPEVSAAAEANGFDSLWMPEHLIFPAEMPPRYLYTPDGYPPMRPDTPAFDPWVVLAAVGAVTQTIRLATGVFILPLRDPIMVARSVVTLDRMSGGRVVLGIGVGWMPDEFEIVGVPFSTRGKRADEMIELMRKLWSEDTIEFHGEFFDIPPVKFQPKPIDKRNGIPIIVGGTSPGAIRRAGRLGDGWIHHVQIKVSVFQGEENPGVDEEDCEGARGHLTDINRHRTEAGREDQPFEVVAGMGSSLDADPPGRGVRSDHGSVGPARQGPPGDQGRLLRLDQAVRRRGHLGPLNPTAPHAGPRVTRVAGALAVGALATHYVPSTLALGQWSSLTRSGRRPVPLAGPGRPPGGRPHLRRRTRPRGHPGRPRRAGRPRPAAPSSPGGRAERFDDLVHEIGRRGHQVEITAIATSTTWLAPPDGSARDLAAADRAMAGAG